MTRNMNDLIGKIEKIAEKYKIEVLLSSTVGEAGEQAHTLMWLLSHGFECELERELHGLVDKVAFVFSKPTIKEQLAEIIPRHKLVKDIEIVFVWNNLETAVMVTVRFEGILEWSDEHRVWKLTVGKPQIIKSIPLRVG